MIARGAIGVSCEDRAGEWNIREFGPGQRREPADFSADCRTPEIGGQSKPESPDRDAAADLVRAAAETECNMDQRQKKSRNGTCDKTEHRTSRLGCHGEADAGAAQHLTFDTQVDDADALGQRLASVTIISGVDERSMAAAHGPAARRISSAIASAPPSGETAGAERRDEQQALQDRRAGARNFRVKL